MGDPVFVAVEGIDASGKSTLTTALAADLRRVGIAVAAHQEPSQGPVGTFFRQLSAKGGMPAMTMALLSAADRHQHQDKLAKSRQRCDIVVSDRYYLSGLAYHAADGIDPAFYQYLNQGVAKPDAYLYLDISPAAAAVRRGGRSDGYWEQHDFAVRLPLAYETCLALVADTESSRVEHIDASLSPHAVLHAALDALSALRPTLFEGIRR